MDKYDPIPPRDLPATDYKPLRYSFVSFEGFLNAKLLVEILKQMGDNPARERIGETVERIKNVDLGIDMPISFGSRRHQGLYTVFYTTVENDRFVSLTDWREWAQ